MARALAEDLELDEDWEDDEEDFEEERPRRGVGAGPDLLARSLALGYLAMVPMILVYELALLSTADGMRNTSELLLFRLFEPLGTQADAARWSVLGLGAVFALATCLRHPFKSNRGGALGPRLFRVIAEGVLGAIALGPVLIGLVHLLGGELANLPLADGPSRPPTLSQAAFVFGAGAYEELVFRVGAYSAFYWSSLRITTFLGLSSRVARVLAEAVGLFGSAALFSAFHLAVFVAWLGPGGEAFDLPVFTWRALAGILLGLLFRWRGPGVAAWTHGLFNLALLLGAGPDVFL